MKRFALALAALAFAFVLPAQAVEKDYNGLGDFTGLDISSVFNVTLTQGTDCSVKVDVDANYIDYIIVEVKGSNLVLRLNYDKMPRRLRSIREDDKLKAYVTMPSLTDLNMSGASKINANGVFNEMNEDFHCELSGACKALGLNVNSKTADIEVSGASTLVLEGNWSKMSAEVSGASKADIDGDVKEIRFEVNGASNFHASGSYTDITGQLSGACKTKIDGRASKAKFEASGVCNLNADGLTVDDIFVEVSGASKATVHPVNNLKVDVSGGSSVYYVDNSGLSINPVSIGRGSTLKAIK
jgi:Protein of unknown function (DUF2807).